MVRYLAVNTPASKKIQNHNKNNVEKWENALANGKQDIEHPGNTFSNG